MKAAKFVALIVGLLGMLGSPDAVLAGDKWVLQFEPTLNAPDASIMSGQVVSPAAATMTFARTNEGTALDFKATGLYPNTLYTIWTVFKVLEPNPANWGLALSPRPGRWR